jgi:hypothetical protein
LDRGGFDFVAKDIGRDEARTPESFDFATSNNAGFDSENDLVFGRSSCGLFFGGHGLIN